MSSAPPRRYRPAPRLVSFLIMLALTAGMVALVSAVYPALEQRWWHSENIDVPLDRMQEMTVPPDAAERYGVVSAARALDAAGGLAGYAVITERQGYASVIRVQSTFSADGQRLAGIRVLSQRETEYLGARISTEDFARGFSGRMLPLKLWGSAALGSPVDGLSGSTISAQAVVDAVNNAYAFLQSMEAA